MTFREAILPYFDGDHLISREANATTLGTEGNPVLETGTAYAILQWRNESVHSDQDAFFEAISAFEKCPGLPNKKPRSSDMVTHDDLIGYVAGSVALGCAFHKELYAYCVRNNWIVTNNDHVQWESIVKPWHRAFYTIAANQPCSMLLKLMLFGAIIVDSLTGMENASDKRLTLLMLKTISHKSRIIDLAGKLWWARIRRVYGSTKRIFIMLKGERHPFSIYCPD